MHFRKRHANSLPRTGQAIAPDRRLIGEGGRVSRTGIRPAGAYWTSLHGSGGIALIRSLAALVAMVVVAALPASAQTEAWERDWSALLERAVVDGNVDYRRLAADRTELDRLYRGLARVDLDTVPGTDARIAFWINAYNLVAIRSVVNVWPVPSPQEVPGMFARNRHAVARRQVTLDMIEKEILPELGADARIHFALVCAARSCPPLSATAYAAGDLDAALDAQVRLALGEPDVLEILPEEVRVSRLFDWYSGDFDAAGGTVAFVNAYRAEPLPADRPIRFQEWDWRLNLPGTSRRPTPPPVTTPDPTTPTDETPPAPPITPPDGEPTPREDPPPVDDHVAEDPYPERTERDLRDYTPSTLLLPGEAEVRTFHNVYTQTEFFDDDGTRQDAGARSTYYTGSVSMTWGWRRNVNPGFDLILRHVSDNTFPAAASDRTGITAIEPRVEFIPLQEFSAVALQTGLRFPIGSDLEGDGTRPFLDWDDVVWNNRLSMDWTFSSDFYVYLESGARIRFGSDDGTDDGQVTVPTKVIPNYHVSDRWTTYLTFETESDWVGDAAGNYFVQTGLGAKYRPRPWLELETLVTTFPAGVNAGAGRTMNLGLRILR